MLEVIYKVNFFVIKAYKYFVYFRIHYFCNASPLCVSQNYCKTVYRGVSICTAIKISHAGLF